MGNYIHPLHQLHGDNVTGSKRPTIRSQVKTDPFISHLEQAFKEPLKLSKHAKLRMEQRNIRITPELWKQVEEKVNAAKAKGIKEPLVVLKEAAMVVSAKNNTVITMMDRSEANGQTFTNIDGTILMG